MKPAALEFPGLSFPLNRHLLERFVSHCKCQFRFLFPIMYSLLNRPVILKRLVYTRAHAYVHTCTGHTRTHLQTRSGSVFHAGVGYV